MHSMVLYPKPHILEHIILQALVAGLLCFSIISFLDLKSQSNNLMIEHIELIGNIVVVMVEATCRTRRNMYIWGRGR